MINYSMFELVIAMFFGEYQTIKKFDRNERLEIDFALNDLSVVSLSTSSLHSTYVP